MIEVAHIAHSGDDLMVVNAARVSFSKESEFEVVEENVDHGTGISVVTWTRLGERDTKLIRYLARNGHWTPFAHPQITMRVKAPLFVRTQCFKHKVGFVENEVSRRYVDDEPEFYLPEVWRARPDASIKQGSDPRRIVSGVMFSDRNTGETRSSEPGAAVSAYYSGALALYEDLIAGGVAPEQARMVLPQSMMTEWYWTGSLAAWARFYRQRTDPHAQWETGELARKANAIIAPLFPASWEALTS